MIYRRKKLDADPVTHRHTDRQTDRQTYISGYRVASSLEEGATKKKRESKHEWSTKGGSIAPIFVPASPGGELARRMKEVAKDEGEKKGKILFKIVEMGGNTLKRELQRSNPLASPGCSKMDCIGCIKQRGEGGQCMRNNINYKIECHLCKNTTPTIYILEKQLETYIPGAENICRGVRRKTHS